MFVDSDLWQVSRKTDDYRCTSLTPKPDGWTVKRKVPSVMYEVAFFGKEKLYRFKLANKELLEISSMRELGPNRMIQVEFTWRWRPNPVNEAFTGRYIGCKNKDPSALFGFEFVPGWLAPDVDETVLNCVPGDMERFTLPPARTGETAECSLWDTGWRCKLAN